MLRRPPTTLAITAEDIAAYEDRQELLAAQRTHQAAQRSAAQRGRFPFSSTPSSSTLSQQHVQQAAYPARNRGQSQAQAQAHQQQQQQQQQNHFRIVGQQQQQQQQPRVTHHHHQHHATPTAAPPLAAIIPISEGAVGEDDLGPGLSSPPPPPSSSSASASASEEEDDESMADYEEQPLPSHHVDPGDGEGYTLAAAQQRQQQHISTQLRTPTGQQTQMIHQNPLRGDEGQHTGGVLEFGAGPVGTEGHVPVPPGILRRGNRGVFRTAANAGGGAGEGIDAGRLGGGDSGLGADAGGMQQQVTPSEGRGRGGGGGGGAPGRTTRSREERFAGLRRGR